ncbi:hypothetical protein [Rufibacter tibetensis]|uniref:Lipoprotein n=1 Tax=Rufibacter tibetensis TaxID=512763 RepID=A0A0P0CR54_9BACT|nr:hypothetical protein [Rufibacter tibetensis]ALI98922.1 hypothetical protein DC20_07945 [Rufibacter tibetensis]
MKYIFVLFIFLATISVSCSRVYRIKYQVFPKRESIKFQNLEDTLKLVIINELSERRLDSVYVLNNFHKFSGKLAVKKDKNYTTIYEYDLKLKNTTLNGVVESFTTCDICMGASKLYKVKSTKLMFCCKDPKHNPNEYEETEEKILAIKKKNKCSKVGLCLD